MTTTQETDDNGNDGVLQAVPAIRYRTVRTLSNGTLFYVCETCGCMQNTDRPTCDCEQGCHEYYV